ncbi:sensor domain-containing protein [Acidovorax lacteus]|uniref:GGDEF domain-containing protein n=1 Tax=Acidovorax lacteus TaxID=1924988 RepID=A0ABP8L2K7_9BURK
MPANALATLNLVDLLLDAVCVVDAQGRYLFVSPAYERIFGYAADEVLGRPMIELVHPADRERTLDAARGIMAGQDQFHFENRYVRKDGRIAHIRWTARWLAGPGVRVAVAHDISQRKRHEAVQAVLYAISEAAHTAPGLHALCVQIRDVIAGLIPAEGFTVALYDASAQTLSFPPGLEPAGLAEGPISLAQAPAYAQVLRSVEPVRWTPESVTPLPWPAAPPGCRPQAHTCWIGVPLPGPRGPTGVLGLWLQQPSDLEIESDASLLQYIATQVAAAVERKRMHQRLEHMARHDLLTGLPNRAHLHERLQAALHRAQPVGDRVDVLFLDLDDFKRVNDTLGHSAGDQLLREVAQRLRATIPERHLLARLGGDEFVVVVEHGACQSEAADVQTRIGAAFEHPFHIGGTGLLMRPSLGHAVFPDHAGDADSLLTRADAAMYAHKRRAPPRDAQA